MQQAVIRRIPRSRTDRCRQAALAICLFLPGPFVVPGSAGAAKLPSPVGAVLLVVDGDIAHSNVDNEAHFDLAMLQALPSHALRTTAPLHEEPQEFEGVRLSALLERVGAGSTTFKAIALDDYSVTFSGIDPVRYPVIIAYRQQGRPIPRRGLGPLRIVMPFDQHESLRTHSAEAMSVWQLVRMSIL